MTRDGATLLCSVLEAAGVRCAFGFPGTPAIPLYEALRRSPVQVVPASQETAAGFMANGYARTSGRLGVLVTSGGPGFAYAIPALAEARLDSAPLLHVSATSSGLPGRRFRHQEIPEASMVVDLVKGIVEVNRAEAIEEATASAVTRALSGEPGPVVVRVSDEALRERISDDPGPCEGPRLPALAAAPGGAALPRNDDGPWSAAASAALVPPALATRAEGARRPVLFAGLGALGAAEPLRTLAEAWPAPVFTTPSARGLLPEDHPLALAFDPVAGGLEKMNELLGRADLVLALGCKLSHAGAAGFRLRLGPDRLVHVNTDRGALGANYATDLPVHARVEPVVAALLDAVSSGASEWTAEEIGRWRARIRSAPAAGPPEPTIRGALGGVRELMTGLRDALPRDAVLVADSGLHQVLVRRHYQVRAPGGLLLPTDFASMGFGIPAAIGAALAAPDRPVAAVVGDGGFAISAMELRTAVEEGIPLPVLVFDDGHLNLIRMGQIRSYGRTHGVGIPGVDLEGLAESLGAAYGQWDREGPELVRDALRQDRPTVVRVPLADSAAIHGERLRGAARSAVRRTIGPGRLARLRERFGRG